MKDFKPFKPLVWCNGALSDAQSSTEALWDRGLWYGDGFFTTMLCYQGRLLNFSQHVQRVEDSLQRLQMWPLAALTTRSAIESWLHKQLAPALTQAQELNFCVIKLIVTRGVAGGGYAPAEQSQPNAYVYLLAAPAEYRSLDVDNLDVPKLAELNVMTCRTPAACHSMLAGLKHLNRLDNVLARQEVVQHGMDEGIMFDDQGRCIGATQGNLVMIKQDVFVTPDLQHAGIIGTALKRLQSLDLARLWQIRDIKVEELYQADALFICNAVRGVQVVTRFDTHTFSRQDVTPIHRAWWAAVRDDINE